MLASEFDVSHASSDSQSQHVSFVCDLLQSQRSLVNSVARSARLNNGFLVSHTSAHHTPKKKAMADDSSVEPLVDITFTKKSQPHVADDAELKRFSGTTICSNGSTKKNCLALLALLCKQGKISPQKKRQLKDRLVRNDPVAISVIQRLGDSTSDKFWQRMSTD